MNSRLHTSPGARPQCHTPYGQGRQGDLPLETSAQGRGRAVPYYSRASFPSHNCKEITTTLPCLKSVVRARPQHECNDPYPVSIFKVRCGTKASPPITDPSVTRYAPPRSSLHHRRPTGLVFFSCYTHRKNSQLVRGWRPVLHRPNLTPRNYPQMQ